MALVLLSVAFELHGFLRRSYLQACPALPFLKTILGRRGVRRRSPIILFPLWVVVPSENNKRGDTPPLLVGSKGSADRRIEWPYWPFTYPAVPRILFLSKSKDGVSLHLRAGGPLSGDIPGKTRSRNQKRRTGRGPNKGNRIQKSPPRPSAYDPGADSSHFSQKRLQAF